MVCNLNWKRWKGEQTDLELKCQVNTLWFYSNDADENDSESKHNGFFNGSPRGDYATNYNKSSNAYYDKNLNYPRQYDSYYFNQRSVFMT